MSYRLNLMQSATGLQMRRILRHAGYAPLDVQSAILKLQKTTLLSCKTNVINCLLLHGETYRTGRLFLTWLILLLLCMNIKNNGPGKKAFALPGCITAIQTRELSLLVLPQTPNMSCIKISAWLNSSCNIYGLTAITKK